MCRQPQRPFSGADDELRNKYSCSCRFYFPRGGKRYGLMFKRRWVRGEAVSIASEVLWVLRRASEIILVFVAWPFLPKRIH